MNYVVSIAQISKSKSLHLSCICTIIISQHSLKFVSMFALTNISLIFTSSIQWRKNIWFLIIALFDSFYHENLNYNSFSKEKNERRNVWMYVCVCDVCVYASERGNVWMYVCVWCVWVWCVCVCVWCVCDVCVCKMCVWCVCDVCVCVWCVCVCKWERECVNVCV